jgi:hypothetical protein
MRARLRKAVPCAFRHIEQWQLSASDSGPVISYRMPPQRQLPCNIEAPYHLVDGRCTRYKTERSQADAARAVFRDEIESAMEVLRLGQADFAMAVDLLAVPATGLRADDALHLAIVHNAAVQGLEILDGSLREPQSS